MAKTLSQAQANYARKIQGSAADNYAKGLNGAPSRYAEGMSRFLGTSVSGSRVSAYSAGLQDAPSAYRAGVSQGADVRWRDGVLRAMTG